MASVTQNIQQVISMQKSAGRPNQQVCTVIAGLKDLCELSGTAPVDWRKASPKGDASPTGRPMFRSGSSGSVSQGGASPFPKSNSSKSLQSASTPPDSPSGSGSGGGAPYSPVAKGGSPYSSTRYQSQFKNSSQPVQDKILNNIILSKLNKFSTSTYDDIREFLYQILGSGEADLADMIRQFMLMVFKKAASEEVYCSLYAKLLSEISSRYGVILEEMYKLQDNYLAIFDDVEQKSEDERYETFVEKNIEKRYRQGYSQFIAELSAFEIIKLSQLEQTFSRIFGCMMKNAVLPEKHTLLEEYADCLVRMSRVFKKKSSPFFASARATLWSLSKSTIESILAKNPAHISISSKTRFILMDVKDNLIA